MTQSSSPPNNNSRIAKNSIFMVVRMVLVLIINLYVSRIVLNNMGISDYGIYGIVGGFVAMVGFICSTLVNGIQRYYNFELGKKSLQGTNAVFNNALRIVIMFSVLLFIVAVPLGMWAINELLNIPGERILAAKIIFHFSLATFIFHLLQIPFTALITAYERLNIYAYISIVQSLLTLGSVLFLSYLNVDYLILYGFSVCLIAFCILLQYIIYCKLHFKEVYLTRNIDKHLLKRMLTFSGWNIFGAAGNLMRSQGLNLVLNIFFGPCINAAREIANQINGGILSFVHNMIMPSTPQMVKAYAERNIFRSLSIFYTTSKFGCYALTILAIPIITEIDFILKLWLGDKTPYHADIFAILILLGSYANTLSATASSFCYATEKIRNYQISGFVFSTLTLVIVFVILHYYTRPENVFIILLIVDIIKHIVGFIIIKNTEPAISCKKYFCSVICPIIAIAVPAFSLAYLINITMTSGILRFFVTTGTTLIVILLCLITFGLNTREKEALLQMIKAIYNRSLKHNA